MSSSPPRQPSKQGLLYALLAAGAALAGAASWLWRRRRSVDDTTRRHDEGTPAVADWALSESRVETAQPTQPAAVAPGEPEPDLGRRPDPLRPWHLAMLIAILALGFLFRFAGLNWDDSQHLHPDERFLTQVLTSISIPDSLGNYFDSSQSSLNPRNAGYDFYVYGDFPIAFVRLVAEGIDGLCLPSPDTPIDAETGRPAPTGFDTLVRGLGFETFCTRADGSFRSMTGYDEVVLVGRVASALFDFGTLIWLFLIARLLYDNRVALAATALGAFAVLHIQQAHFFTSDSFATHFAAAAFYFIVRAQQTGRLAHFAAAGVGVGLAMACRINIAPLLGIVAVAAAARVLRAWHDLGVTRGARIERAVLQVVVAGVVAFASFHVFMPNAFDGLILCGDNRSEALRAQRERPGGLPGQLLCLDDRWLENMASIQRAITGEDSAPWDIQWTDRKALVFPWVNMVFWGLGVPLGLAAWAGWALAGWKLFGKTYRRNRGQPLVEWLRDIAASKHVLVWAWVTPYFVWQGSQWVKSIRYLLPLYPFMAIFAGWLIVSAWRWARKARVSATGVSATGVSATGVSATGVSATGVSATGVASYVAYALPVVVIAGAFLWAVAFTEIYRRPITRVAASDWIYENVPSAATIVYADADGSRRVQLPLREVSFEPGRPVMARFEVPADGDLTGVRFEKMSAVGGGDNSLRVRVALDPEATQVIAEGQIDVPQSAAPGSYSLTFPGARLSAGQSYYFVGEATSGVLAASGSVLGNEHFDDGLPLRTGGRDGFGFYYRGIEVPNYNEDQPEKVGQMVGWLQEADYLMLTSNRLYGSIPRQPLRYPLASEYYRLLFTGQLGYDLVAEFTSYATLGPFEFADQETTQALGLWPDPTRIANPDRVSVPYPPAEEAFSVYDHPRVLIFKKRADFSVEAIMPLLSRFDLEQVYHGLKPRDEVSSPTGQMLTEAAWETQQASGTWADIFDRNSLLNTAPGVGVIAWYVVIALIGVAAFPILYVAAPGLADRGYGLARTLGVLLLSFLIWFPASYRLLPFTREAILLAAIVLAAIGGLIVSKKRLEIGDWVRRNARLIAVEEIVFAAAFVLFLALRFGNPDLWHPWKGGEKPMDFAYFNAVIKSQYFPPYDPWFSGGFMTYYYYGWVMFGAVTKLLGIVPAIAYNIVVPTVYALAALASFSVAHGIAVRFGVRSRIRNQVGGEGAGNSGSLPIVVGVLAAVFVMLIGNLGEVKLLYDEIGKVCTSQDPESPCSLDVKSSMEAVGNTSKFVGGLLQIVTGRKSLTLPTDWWYWNPTRIIPPGEGEPGPITEFPFFTFLYADLHAHMMALPLTILLLGLAVSWVVRVPLPHRSSESSFGARSPDPRREETAGLDGGPVGDLPTTWLKTHWAGLLSLVLGGLALGALRAANTADYPTYLGVGLVALAFGTWAAEPLAQKETWFWFVVRVALFYVSAAILFAPFGPSDRLGGTSLQGWEGSKTEFWAYVFVHGIFLFPIATYLFLEARRWGVRWMVAAWNSFGEWRWLLGAAAIGAGLLALFFVLNGVAALIVAAPLMAAAAVMMLRPRLPATTRFWLLMVLTALALSMAVELVVFGDDIGRMNMVFKIYYQVWVLLGIAGAVALGWLWQRASRDLPRLNGGWKTSAVVLIVAGMLYPPFAARGKLMERFYENAPPGLDGMAYMLESTYWEVNDAGVNTELTLRWDYEAIAWLQDSVPGTPVVAEGRSRHEYLWGSRISIYTGLPTLLGWAHHQRQQRGVVVPHRLIDQRIQDTQSLYSDPSIVTARKIIDRYGVKYIVVGELETMYYSPEGLEKFEQMVTEGYLGVAFSNPGVTIYEVVSTDKATNQRISESANQRISESTDDQ